MDAMTRILVDNSTLAAAGRAMYLGDFSVEGGMHAEIYYRRFADAREEDVHSLAELLSIFVLFDQVLWEGSSCAQESRVMDNSNAAELGDSAWVYDWFPLYRDAHNNGAIQHYFASSAWDRLREAQRRAAHWVVTRVQSGTYEVQRGFRIPLAYSAEDHYERADIVKTAVQNGLELQARYIPLALFLSRGLYYQSVSYEEPSCSYAPHSFRASLLANIELQASALLSHVTYDSADILRRVDAVLLERALAVADVPPSVLQGVAVGAAFLRRSASPRAAFDDAMAFRESSGGREVRDLMREMITLVSEGAYPSVSLVLSDIDRQLRGLLLERFGFAPARQGQSSGDELGLLFGLMGAAKTLLAAALELLPAAARKHITQLLYTSLTEPSGFQLLFERYLPHQ
jgi:hypothetical protein